jgi:hypothetical protein
MTHSHTEDIYGVIVSGFALQLNFTLPCTKLSIISNTWINKNYICNYIKTVLQWELMNSPRNVLINMLKDTNSLVKQYDLIFR